QRQSERLEVVENAQALGVDRGLEALIGEGPVAVGERIAAAAHRTGDRDRSRGERSDAALGEIGARRLFKRSEAVVLERLDVFDPGRSRLDQPKARIGSPDIADQRKLRHVQASVQCRSTLPWTRDGSKCSENGVTSLFPFSRALISTA